MNLFEINCQELSNCKYVQPNSCIISTAKIKLNNQTHEEYYVKIILKLHEQELETLKLTGKLIDEFITIHGYDRKNFLDNNNGIIEIYAYYLSNSIRKTISPYGRLDAPGQYYGLYYPSKNSC